jgi:hypothetical protein
MIEVDRQCSSVRSTRAEKNVLLWQWWGLIGLLVVMDECLVGG